jgi:hypothetical protein
MLQFLIQAVFYIISFILHWGIHFEYNIIPATSWYYIWHSSTNKLYHCNCWCDSHMYKNSLIHEPHSRCHRSMYNCLLVPCHACPIWPPILPPNLTYTLLILLQLSYWTCSVEMSYIPCGKSCVCFPVHWLFQRISPRPRPCVTFRKLFLLQG